MVSGPVSERPGALVARPTALVAGLLVMAAMLGLLVLAARPPAAKNATAPANAFSAGRAMQTLERLLGDGAPHPIGSEANARLAERIGDELAAMGYAVEEQEAFACRAAWGICGSVRNVIARLPGETDGPAVLLTAHYDSVSAGPGAGDDMAGVTAILEVARILVAEAPPRNPVIFLLSDGEENALLGAEAFVAEHPWAADVGAVFNLEANGTDGQSVLFETAGDNGWLIAAFAAGAARPVASSVYDAIYELIPFNTDLSVYEEAGLPGYNFAFIDEHPRYHTPLDNAANLSPESLQHHGDNALALAHALGASDLANPAPGRSVFQDLFSLFLLHWPEPWTVWIALVVAAVWIGVGVAAARRGDVFRRPLLWGLLAFLAGVLAAAGLGFALGEAVRAIAGAAIPWYAHPLPMRIAVGVGALLVTIGLAGMLARRAGFWGMYLGVWLWWSLLAVIVAAIMPGLSPLALIPTALAGAAAIASVSPWRRSPRAWEAAALVGLFGASWGWLGFTRGSDFTALGPDLGPTVGAAVGVAGTALMPLVAPPAAYGRFWRPALAGTAALALVAAVVATQVPPSSASRPLRLNVLHVQERGADETFWVLDSELPLGRGDLGRLQGLLQAGGFGGETAALLPWSSEAAPAAPATVAADRPVLELVSDETANGEGGRVVTVEMRSAAGENRVSPYVPVSAGLRRVVIPGEPRALEGLPVEEGFGRFHCVGAGCDGLRLELHFESGGAVTLYAAETAPGLPAGGEALIAARPDFAAPSGGGDQTIVVDRVELAGR